MLAVRAAAVRSKAEALATMMTAPLRKNREAESGEAKSCVASMYRLGCGGTGAISSPQLVPGRDRSLSPATPCGPRRPSVLAHNDAINSAQLPHPVTVSICWRLRTGSVPALRA